MDFTLEGDVLVLNLGKVRLAFNGCILIRIEDMVNGEIITWDEIKLYSLYQIDDVNIEVTNYPTMDGHLTIMNRCRCKHIMYRYPQENYLRINLDYNDLQYILVDYKTSYRIYNRNTSEIIIALKNGTEITTPPCYEIFRPCQSVKGVNKF